jgi:hypothetical protein
MKNNTEQAKKLLVQTIRAMPGDFALSEARSYLTRALSEIEYIESKRTKKIPNNREANIAPIAEQRTANVAGNWTPQQVMGVINYIDVMIESEKAKIAEIHARQNKTSEPEEDQEFFRD